MAKVREIAQLGQPVLRAIATPVSELHSIQSLIDDLFVTVAAANGVGLAAPQVFESSSVFLISSRPNPRYPHAPSMEPTVMINPSILTRSSVMKKDWEGCLSIPGLRGLVPRHDSISVEFLDRDGARHTMELSGFLARVFQHEYDHLEGAVFLDRLEDSRDLVTEQEYLRIIGAPSPA